MLHSPETYDLIIAGGSTGGLSTAIYAKLAGYSVLVVDPQPGLRDKGLVDKPCGEGLMPAALMRLKEMGVQIERSFPLKGVRYIYEKHQAFAPFYGGVGLGVRRTELRRAMRARAEDLGVDFLTAKVETFEDLEFDVLVLTSQHQLHAKWLVCADGLRSHLRKILGAAPPHHRPRHPPRFGLRRHYALPPWSPEVEVHWSKNCELYITPVEENLVNIACLFSKPQTFEACLAQFPQVLERLPPSAVTPLMGAGPFEQCSRFQQKGRVFLVGDAAGFLDPLTGEGNQLAMAAAKEVIDSLAQGHPKNYNKAWRKGVRRYWILTSLLLAVARKPFFRCYLVPFLERWPGVMKFFLKHLSPTPN
jgi:flavin-dependent dehydrogenase